MPFTVQENQIGQLWSFAEVSRLNTSGGEGVKILYNQEFELPVSADGKIVNTLLPEYEHVEIKAQSSGKLHKSSSKSTFRKSSSKENFKKNGEVGDEEPEDEGVENNDCSVDIANTRENIHSKTGQYTKKMYMMESRLPWFIRKLLPKESTVLNEKSWNMYPTVKTLLTNDYFKNSFRIQLDTITKAVQNGVPDDNVHNLTAEQLAVREVVVCDISEQVPSNEYKADEDPCKFKSVRTGRGPLLPGWINKQQPLICVYKLICIEFKVFGLQTKVESYLKNMYKSLFVTFHRQIFCWMDRWYGLTIEDIRRIEDELANALVTKIQEGEISNYGLIEE